MRYMIAAVALLALLCPARAQQGPIYCNQATATPVGFTTKAQVIAAPSGTSRIAICGWVFSAVAASVITFQSGTGSNCATGSAATGTTIQLGTTATTTYGDGVWSGWQLPAATALCVTGTVAANGQVFWTLLP